MPAPSSSPDRSPFAIDELNLERECIRQPELYFKYARRAADAKLKQDEAKVAYDVQRAKLEKRIRLNPKKWGLQDKPTEKAISATLDTDPVLVEALGEIARASHEVNLCHAAVTTCEHRKRSLTLLVDLQGQQLNASPRISTAGKQAVEAKTKDRVRKMGQVRDKDEDDDS